MTMTTEELLEEFEDIDEAVGALEEGLHAVPMPTIDNALPTCMRLTHRMLDAYGRYRGCEMPGDDADLLDVLKGFVKGDPSLNAVRDNVRELVYYRNCIDMDRREALPASPEKAAVRTVRHIYLYLRTRLLQEERRTVRPLHPM